MTEAYQGPTPPPELVRQWLRERPPGELAHTFLATQAARWGADQELKACANWLTDRYSRRALERLQELEGGNE